MSYRTRDAMTTSLNAQASNVFSYLRRAHPSSSEEEIAAMMGFPLDALVGGHWASSAVRTYRSKTVSTRSSPN